MFRQFFLVTIMLLLLPRQTLTFLHTRSPPLHLPRLLSTQYTIDPPSRNETVKLLPLLSRIHTNKQNFLAHHVVPAHTIAAFDSFKALLPNLPSLNGARNLILDHGCGTGTSTYNLAALHPNHYVLGIDRSSDRLSRGRTFPPDSHLFLDPSNPRVILLRAEISSFMILLSSFLTAPDFSFTVTHQKIYYPNPYPPTKLLSSRVYGLPSFPILLSLGGEIELRSNWEHYVDQFSIAVQALDELEQRSPRPISKRVLPSAAPGVSRFEDKYFKCNEACFGTTFLPPPLTNSRKRDRRHVRRGVVQTGVHSVPGERKSPANYELS